MLPLQVDEKLKTDQCIRKPIRRDVILIVIK